MANALKDLIFAAVVVHSSLRDPVAPAHVWGYINTLLSFQRSAVVDRLPTFLRPTFVILSRRFRLSTGGNWWFFPFPGPDCPGPPRLPLGHLHRKPSVSAQFRSSQVGKINVTWSRFAVQAPSPRPRFDFL